VRQNTEPEATTEPVADPLHLNAVQVLLIDGSSSDGSSLRNALKWDLLKAFRITRKRTLSEGRDALKSTLFQIVLLDVSVSRIFWIESLAEILQVAKGVPVIILDDEPDTTAASEAMRLGARDYVRKECGCNSLIRAMNCAIERKHVTSPVEEGTRLITKDKEEIMARGYHELRNAVACIHQFGNILLGGLAGPISEEQRKYVGIMTQNASRIRTVIKSLTEVVSASSDECMDQTDHVPATDGVH
jgi:DNA-binding NarL/FixJ family response regulator